MTAKPTVNEMMEAYALDAVDHAKQAFGRELDFSPASVREVEEILGSLYEARPGLLRRLFSRSATQEMVWKVAKMYGGYVGEVFRKSGGGEWFLDEEIMPGLPIPGLQKEDHRIWPPAKVGKRLTNGPEDNVWHYFQIVAPTW